jgi:glycosyltransferase involved in cell wall biosynthesis
LIRAIRRDAPDVVQTYGFHGNVRGLVAGRAAGVPVRLAGRRELARFLTPAQRRADRWAWRLAQRIVVNSDAVRRQMTDEERVRPDRIVVIRNGLDLKPWLGARDVGDERQPVVGMVAHFREDKDHDTFLLAAGEVLRHVPSARFCLVGSGPLESFVRAQASRLGLTGSVEFSGHLDADALRMAVSRFRVAVLASRTEGLPNTVLEAMAAGRPVVATAVGGTTEIVEDGVTGFLVPAGDPATLAERITALLREPSLASTMGARGQRKVADEFTTDRMAHEFDDLYRRLLRARPGGGG